MSLFFLPWKIIFVSSNWRASDSVFLFPSIYSFQRKHCSALDLDKRSSCRSHKLNWQNTSAVCFILRHAHCVRQRRKLYLKGFYLLAELQKVPRRILNFQFQSINQSLEERGKKPSPAFCCHFISAVVKNQRQLWRFLLSTPNFMKILLIHLDEVCTALEWVQRELCSSWGIKSIIFTVLSLWLSMLKSLDQIIKFKWNFFTTAKKFRTIKKL